MFSRMVARVFRREIQQGVRNALAVTENDRTFGGSGRVGLNGERERPGYEREEVQRQALEAWRSNPLARRMVELTTHYVAGGGLTFTCRHEPTRRFLEQFWNHALNRMEVRCGEWCDELTRTGNLFILLSTDPAGMSYVRAIPAESLERIETRPNDLEQPLRYYPKPTLEEPSPAPWLAYDPAADSLQTVLEERAVVMLHYAINRPVGAQWGESDLAPLLRWLTRYSAWLEDRLRLNHFRNSFLFVLRTRFQSEAERLARQQYINSSPPPDGSILVCDENETWDTISPKLEASDANTDGLALKKVIAAGAGLPLHFLAEPESATRTTAEAAGGPTYRRFEQRQRFFLWLVRDVLSAAAARRSLFDRRVSRRAEIEVRGADISSRDNLELSNAAAGAVRAFGELRERGVIDDAELLRVVYRFANEPLDMAEMLERSRADKTTPEV